MGVFSEKLQIKKGMTAIIGGGGKTSLMMRLADELKSEGTVIVCTTTHIMRPEGMPVLTVAGAEDIRTALAGNRLICVGEELETERNDTAGKRTGGKMKSPEIGVEALAQLADYVLIEADGSKHLPLKAHRDFEPVIPEGAYTVYIIGADGINGRIEDVCHCPELYAGRCGARSAEEIATPERIAAVIRREGFGDVFFINKAETEALRSAAQKTAEMLPGAAFIGSIKSGFIL